MQAKKPVKVEFVGLVPTLFAHCAHCMDIMQMCDLDPYYEQLKEYPKDIVELYYNVTKLAVELKREFGADVYVDVVDPASLQGLWKTIRYMILKTPCVVVNGKKAFEKVPTYQNLRSLVQFTLASSQERLLR